MNRKTPCTFRSPPTIFRPAFHTHSITTHLDRVDICEAIGRQLLRCPLDLLNAGAERAEAAVGAEAGGRVGNNLHRHLCGKSWGKIRAWGGEEAGGRFCNAVCGKM